MWKVCFKKSVSKDFKKLPLSIKEILFLLVQELELLGPYRSNWPNYGKLRGRKECFHCHIKKGNPTMVVLWEIKDKTIKLMEVSYVGTHEKAPY